MGHGCKAMYLKASLGSVPSISRNATFYRHSLILHNMMKQFQITSESNTVKEFPRCPCGMGWTPIRLLLSCILWNPSFPSQVKYKLRLDTWFSLCCVWGYSHSEYKLNYLIPHFITIPNRGSSWTAHEVSEWHIVHCLASHRSWLIHKAEVGDGFGDIDVLEDLRSGGTPGISQKGPPDQSCGTSVIGSSSSGESTREKPVYYSGSGATVCLANVTRSDFLDGLKGQLQWARIAL